MHNRQSLTSLHILVTRPNTLEKELCEEIERLGGKTTHFPVIQIVEPKNITSRRRAIDTVNDYDLAIFISPTAVSKTAEHINLSKLDLLMAAIGSATATALEQQNVTVQIKPEGNDSESLLQHPLLQTGNIKNKRIILFKGEGGRTLLSDTLLSRGAEVFRAELYRRTKPDSYTPLSRSLLDTIDVILVSSGEGLTNLISMTDEKSLLTDIKIMVPGNRCAKLAKQAGFKQVIKTTDATNRSFISTLLQ